MHRAVPSPDLFTINTPLSCNTQFFYPPSSPTCPILLQPPLQPKCLHSHFLPSNYHSFLVLFFSLTHYSSNYFTSPYSSPTNPPRVGHKWKTKGNQYSRNVMESSEVHVWCNYQGKSARYKNPQVIISEYIDY